MYKRIVTLGMLWAFCVGASGGQLADANKQADRVHSNGKTALMTAARQGDNERIRDLLRQGADVNRTNHNGGSPIMYAHDVCCGTTPASMRLPETAGRP